MEKHINIVAALQIGLSVFNLIIALLIFTLFKLIIGFVDEPGVEMVLSIIANVVAVFFVIISLPGIFAGLGLFKRQEWARILTLVLSVIGIFNFPFGTAIGIYSIWALVQPEIVAEFNSTATGQGNMK